MKQLYIFILPFVFFMASCHKNPIEEPTSGSQQNADLVKVDFKLSLPGSQQPLKTYAIAETDENTIQHVILLAFKVANGIESLDYYKEGMQIYDNSSNEKSFWASLPKSTDDYRFVLLVNPGAEISGIVANIAKETTKSAVMEQLVSTIESKWNASSSGNFTPLPMWGESGIVSGINAQTNNLPPIKLLRSLARVDIILSDDAVNDFSITSVHLFNASDKAYIAPAVVNFDPLNDMVTAPSIPAGISPLPVQDYLLPEPVKSLEHEIYLFESKKANTIGAPDATALVIGGKYKDSGITTYYRVDFLNNNNPVDLLRNHTYIINITLVNGPGLPSPNDAFNAKNINMNVNIVPWNEGETTYEVIGGEFILNVPLEINLNAGADIDKPIAIETDYPDGWTASATTNPDNFITITHASGGTGPRHLIYNQTANSTGAVRKAVITVKAGNLTKIITLIQPPSEE